MSMRDFGRLPRFKGSLGAQMSDQLRNFFNSLQTEADLSPFCTEAREEDLHLEFKSKADSRNGDLGEGERKAFSKALSGFANADGGVLIFGVKTRKATDTPDCASALHPIENVGQFRVRLLDSIIQATQPAVDGVRIEVIASTDTSGYVKCLVPASDKPPHRAMLASREYWRRTTSGHLKMEHYELEDAFGRRLRPLLKMRVQLLSDTADPRRERLTFFLKNEGRGVAKFSGFLCLITGTAPLTFSGITGLTDVSKLNSTAALVFSDNVGVIHPNGIYLSAGEAVFIRENRDAPLSMQLNWYAENMAARQIKIDLRAGTAIEA